MPTHQYAQMATTYTYSSNPAHSLILHNLAESCRAYTRVVLRLRSQAEVTAAHAARYPQPERPAASKPATRGVSPAASHRSQGGWPTSPSRGNASRASSRAPSPSSSFTYSRSGHVASRAPDQQGGAYIPTFRSPLFRPRRAPLLQVFVPSPESDWLSDAGVLDCEQELKRAGVLHLMRAGDVVWDTAVGDEGNIGRLVWDGSYLIVREWMQIFFHKCADGSFQCFRIWITHTPALEISLSSYRLWHSHRRISIGLSVQWAVGIRYVMSISHPGLKRSPQICSCCRTE